MAAWTRRGLLGAGAIAALSGCGSNTPSSPRPGPATSTAASTGGATGTTGAARLPWRTLRRRLSGTLVRPGDPGYDALRLTPNPRYDGARPLALLEAASAADVSAGLRFAADQGIPLAVRAGGHSYPGWSAGGTPPALVIDCRRLAGVTWQGTTATVGPGARLGKVYPAIARRGRAIAGGSCPTVGIGGLTLGGGVGVVTRAYGLTCDALTSARVVLADGRTVTASTEEESDLFWALRGGGGGHLGIATSLTFRTVAAPTLTTSYLTWRASEFADVVPAWFDWLDDADPRLWSTLKLLGGAAHPEGPSLGATVTWVGPNARFDRALAPLMSHAPAPTGRYDRVRGFLEAMRAYGGSGAREAFAATSHVAYDPLPTSACVRLLDLVAGAPDALHEAGVSIDALGGHVADLAPDETAFVHRRARATVQYTATYDAGPAHPAQRFVERLRAAMTPSWGDHAYVNYADASLAHPGPAYFGDNWPRLQSVRADYDPHGLFTQPQ